MAWISSTKFGTAADQSRHRQSDHNYKFSTAHMEDFQRIGAHAVYLKRP
jgi:hypothetical protein